MKNAYACSAGTTHARNQIESVKTVVDQQYWGVAMQNDGKTCFWLEGKRCPRCGCSLISDGKLVWCSFVGGDGQKACSYGIDGTDILIESI